MSRRPDNDYARSKMHARDFQYGTSQIMPVDDALKNGTLDWDVTVRNLLILILTSALQCRAGDIFKDNLDNHELPFIAYGIIRLRLANGMQIEHLEALVTIRNEKGAK